MPILKRFPVHRWLLDYMRIRIAAGEKPFEDHIQRLAGQIRTETRFHSIELPDGRVLPGLQSVKQLRRRLDCFGLPQDLHGKRVLDIGAWDGWFSFECERRGADVVAVDCIEMDTFHEARELIGSKVEYLTLDVNELSPQRLGTFDIVLFFGVLYHLRHPLLGLEKVVALSTDLVLIESYVIKAERRRIPTVMEFYESAELGGQLDNWCGPSPECLLSMCRSAGLAQVELKDITKQRASITARRRWPEPDPTPSAPAPRLHAVVSNRTFKSVFHPLKDEYLSCYFKSEEKALREDSLLVEVDGFGTHAMALTQTQQDGYQANCLRPPGLAPGPHSVRIRTRNSGRSNTAVFTMLDEFGNEVPTASGCLPPEPPELCSAELQLPGDLRLAINRGGSLVCCFRSAADVVAPRDVVLELGGRTARADAVSFLGDNNWQANLLLSEHLVGEALVRLRLGKGAWSQPALVRRLS